MNPAYQGTGLPEFTTMMSNAFLSKGPFETLAFLAVYASKGRFSFGSTFGSFRVLSSSSRKDQGLGRVEEQDLLPYVDRIVHIVLVSLLGGEGVVFFFGSRLCSTLSM